MRSAHIIISGFVQGVGFRQFVKSNAQKLNITGWVKNTPDAGVETLFQGSKEQLEEMIKRCKKGPFLAQVDEVVVTWRDEQQHQSFEINL